MRTYRLEKDTMRAVRSILTASEKTAAPTREWTKLAYLSMQGLAVTDSRRLLRVHDKELDEEFGSFLQETGRIVVLSLEGDSLKLEYDIAKNDSKLGTLERLIPSQERFNGPASSSFLNVFTDPGKTPKPKEIAKSMVNTAILKTGLGFDPDRFDGMGIRPWSRVFPMESMVAFNAVDEDEVFICMGKPIWRDDIK